MSADWVYQPYVYEQDTPSSSWVVSNPMSRFSCVEVFDTIGNKVDCDITISGGVITLNFFKDGDPHLATGKVVIT